MVGRGTHLNIRSDIHMKLVECISKVDFGKKGYNDDNNVHVMVAKSVAKNTPKN
jgi:hypothetical protein